MFRLFFVILSLFSFCTSSGSVHAFLVDIEDIKPWVPTRLSTPVSLKKIQDIILEEKQVVTKVDKSEGRREFGFSAPGLDSLKIQCLSIIKARYETTGKRPLILDAGAGHGYMSLKMIIAGGHVTAQEKQQATAVELQKTIGKVKSFLGENENFKSVCKLIVGDASNFKDNPAYPQTVHYYLTWSGLLLHFFTPSQAEDYVYNLFKITDNGGYAFATVNPPCTDPKIVSFYKQQEEKGVDFPGYLVINKKITGTYTASTDTQQDVPEIVNVEAPKLKDKALPGQVKYGSYGKEIPEIQCKVISSDKNQTIAEYEEHTFKHLMGPNVLKRLFEKAGFKIEDLYYIGETGQIPADKMSDELLSKGAYFLAIMAKKP